jgi:hypothetical protein
MAISHESLLSMLCAFGYMSFLRSCKVNSHRHNEKIRNLAAPGCSKNISLHNGATRFFIFSLCRWLLSFFVKWLHARDIPGSCMSPTLRVAVGIARSKSVMFVPYLFDGKLVPAKTSNGMENSSSASNLELVQKCSKNIKCVKY